MRDELSEIMIESVHDVFLAFLAMEVFPGPAIEKPSFDPYEPPETDVTVVVGFSGAVNGGIHLCCPLAVALRLSSSMAGETFNDMQGEASDALGELANMIAGGVQTSLSSQGEIHLTPPAMVTETQLGMDYQEDFSSFKQYFKVDEGPFFVECFFAP